MIAQPKVHQIPGGQDFGPLDGHDAQVPGPAIIEGVTFFPANGLQTGISASSNGARIIVICVSTGPSGLMQGLSTDGARAIASSLSILADMLEAEAAGEAAAAIDAVRKDVRN